MEDYGTFKLFYVVSQLIGLTAIGLLFGWVGGHLGGFAWRSNPAIEFNLHPVLMVIGLVYLYGNCK